MNKAHAALLWLLCGTAAACGGNKSTWQLTIRTPPDDDLFKMGVSQVLLSVGDKQQTAPVSGGTFSVSLDMDNPTTDTYIRLSLAALDGTGQVVARGLSPNLVLTASSSTTTQVTIYVARVGKVSTTSVRLLGDDMMTPAGRADLSVTALRGRTVTPTPQSSLGMLITGGADGAGALLTRSWLYDPLTHTLLNAGLPKVPRRGAVLVPSADTVTGQQALLWGGQADKEVLPTAAEVFDPQVASLDLVFSAPAPDVADALTPGALLPTAAEVSSGVFLVSGGLDKPGGTPLAQAVVLQRYQPATGSGDSALHPGVRRVPPLAGGGPMAAKRFGHSATPVALAAGAGLLIYGGTGDDQSPLAEIYAASAGTFSPLTLTGGGAERRMEHVAFATRDGRVLIAGGRGANGTALASALLINPSTGAAEARTDFLRTARSRAAVAVFGSEILICGGVAYDDKGIATPLDTCEIFTQDLIAAQTQGRVESMPRPRAGHVMVPLETGNLLFIGGTGPNGALLAEIDAYTSR